MLLAWLCEGSLKSPTLACSAPSGANELSEAGRPLGLPRFGTCKQPLHHLDLHGCPSIIVA